MNRKKNNKNIKNRKDNFFKENKIVINKETIVWTYSQWKWDFGFVDVEWIEKWYFVFWRNKNSALDGDTVEASLKVFKWKKEATVEKVLERKQDLIVWKYQEWKDNRFWFVLADNPFIKNDIFVPWKKSLEAKNWDIVWVQVTKWSWKNPEWTIREIIGKEWDKKIKVNSLIIEAWSKLNFPEKVLKSAENIKVEDSTRKDLTNLFTFTIDWEDAKDLDDAISIEEIEQGYKLYVHIADVAHYVTEKSILDIEAYKRATSVYLVDRVIPMLPEKLSNDLCSLNPNTKKLTLTCEMTIWNNWAIKSQKVYESIIESNHRLTYKEVDDILNWDLRKSEKLEKTLKIANQLKQKITKYRKSTWVLDFEFPETKIILDEDNKPVSIKEYPRYESNKMIEEFMISANQAVSMEFSKLPFLYRIHEEPKIEDLAKLQETLNLFWINFVFKNNTTKEFSMLLEQISKLDEAKKMFLEKTILRALTKAVYSKENFWHFGLGLSFYSHFTSPIRRYPDLQIHRIIKEKIAWKLDKKRLLHYENILESVSKYTSDKERKAEKLEYKVRDYFVVQFYKDRVGEEFEATISWVLAKWFFVALSDTSEWFVELKNSQYIEWLQEHHDLSNWNKYRLADKINVKLVEADETMFRLNFEIVSYIQ